MSLLYASRMIESHQDGYDEGIAIGLERGLEQGLERGLEQGAYQKALETAQALLTEGLTPAMVARCTGLPIETVQSLI